MNREELLEIAKPILFNTEMVQAILEGRKTCTRRVVPERILDKYYDYDDYCLSVMPTDIPCMRDYEKEFFMKRTPYKVGDILYVREKFNNDETTSILYAADKEFIDFGCKEVDGYLFMENEIKWKPSIHMPKEAARIFLKVTDVRVERLQDITIDQLDKEGFGNVGHPIDKPWHEVAYKKIKEVLNCKDEDWVWVIEFERINEQSMTDKCCYTCKNNRNLLEKDYPCNCEFEDRKDYTQNMYCSDYKACED